MYLAVPSGDGPGRADTLDRAIPAVEGTPTLNIFTIIGTLLHILSNAPDLVDDVEDFWQKIQGKTQPADYASVELENKISDTRNT